MPGQRILMLVGDFGEDYEITVPFHAPLAVGRNPTTAGVLDGYEMTAYPAVRPEAAGCSWVDGVTTDGNLVTGQAWPDHPESIAEFLDLLGTDIDHDAPAAAAD